MPDSEVEGASVSKRRVYDLPTELVERIVEFQKERGLPSEVEAVRKLLDMSLKSRDTLEALVGRYLAALTPGTEPGEAAGTVLSGHPLVKRIAFPDVGIEFSFQFPNSEPQEVTVLSAELIAIDPSAGNVVFKYVYDQSKPRGKRLYNRYEKSEEASNDIASRVSKGFQQVQGKKRKDGEALDGLNVAIKALGKKKNQ